MDTKHTYRIKATSTAVRSGFVAAEDVQPSIAFSAPVEFRGQPGYWTPEHLLIAAVSSCFISTFSGMSDVSKFDFLFLDLEAEGVLEKDEGGWRFKEIFLRPQLRIAHEEQRELGNRLLQKAERNCLVARSLACAVTLESEIKIEELTVAT